MTRDDDGVWSVRGKKGWRDARYRFEVTVYAPSTQQIETNLVTDPYSLGLTTNSERSVLVDLRRKAVTPAGWKGLRKPAFRTDETPTVYELHVRDFSVQRRDGAGGAPRHVPRLHRPAQRRDAAPAGAGPGGHGLRPPAARQRHRLHRGGPQPAGDPAVRPGLVRAGERGAAGLRHGGRGEGRLQLGLRPAALHGARGLVRDRPGGHGPQPGVPADGRRAEPGRAAGRHGRRLQPHAGLRAGPEVDPRPRRARLLPAAERDGLGGELHVLREHRDRAPDDGEAHDRLRRHLGARLQGRRLPLRPHGPPAQGRDARPAAGARQADGQAGRRRRQAGPPLRRGLELRRGRRQRAVRPGHPGRDGGDRDRDVQRPAARLRPGRRAVRRGPARAGLRERPLHRPQRRRRERDAGGAAGGAAARPGPDQGRAGGQPRGLPVRRPHRGPRARRRRRLQRAADRLHEAAGRGGQLRRGARQRDAVRRADLQAADVHLHGRPGADADARPGHDRAQPGHLVLDGRRRPAAEQVLRPQQLRLRRLVQRDRLVPAGQRLRPRACRRRRTTSPSGPSSGRCSRTPR